VKEVLHFEENDNCIYPTCVLTEKIIIDGQNTYAGYTYAAILPKPVCRFSHHKTKWITWKLATLYYMISHISTIEPFHEKVNLTVKNKM